MKAAQALRSMNMLPCASLDEILRGHDPLVLAPHADDESLGCGGLLAACTRRGMRPAILVLTDGAGSHPGSREFPPERLRAVRVAETRNAAAILGVLPERIGFLGLPDTAAPHHGPGFDAAVDAIADHAARWSCGIVLAPWRHDPHGDHLAAHRMAAALGIPHLAYPVWALTLSPEAELGGPAPQGFRFAIDLVRDVKRRAIAAHVSQHGGLIQDDPAGFLLEPAFLARFDTGYEIFLTNP